MRRLSIGLYLVGMALAPGAWAEPYLAVQSGFTCGACHTNNAGGGQRTAFGNAYLQQTLSANAPAAEDVWTGTLAERFTLGANARSSARQFEFDDRDDSLDFAVDRVSLYLGAQLNDHVSFYIDQQVAPGTSLNREAWAKLTWDRWYLKAGRLFVPLGWRVEDDTAFVREVTGVNMRQGDDGLELGFESPTFTFQLAASNGNGGGPERDDGKQFAARAEYIQPRWRFGASGLRNDTDFGDRSVYGVFAGLRTGRVSWLAEYDRVEDRIDGLADVDQGVGLLEANVRLARGHNLKLSAEVVTLDDQPDRYRGSVVYEYFPWAFAQLRLGLRARDSDVPSAALNSAALNSEEAFVQLHLLF